MNDVSAFEQLVILLLVIILAEVATPFWHRAAWRVMVLAVGVAIIWNMLNGN